MGRRWVRFTAASKISAEKLLLSWSWSQCHSLSLSAPAFEDLHATLRWMVCDPASPIHLRYNWVFGYYVIRASQVVRIQLLTTLFRTTSLRNNYGSQHTTAALTRTSYIHPSSCPAVQNLDNSTDSCRACKDTCSERKKIPELFYVEQVCNQNYNRAPKHPLCI